MNTLRNGVESQSLFYWIIYSYNYDSFLDKIIQNRLNPYFTGLSILIIAERATEVSQILESQSLFYWIIYSYYREL